MHGLPLKPEEKQSSGVDTKRFDNEIVEIFDKLSEHICHNPTQHKRVLIIFNLL